MYLKSLELQGFKSFPNPTTIDFHPGVTAIVGPNGSGKSNVTDAVRWVLGEQSVRTLRGGTMEDVIFSGTEQRRAMGFAEVSLTLINDDRALPIEYEEVEITRRLFRSGESEYLINRQSCRLKDIVNLFMDTGLGKDGYSIIGQGQIDNILSSKSEDRRKIFEEAAGIQKYKSRRDESLRKLNHTEQNLTRITDLLNELSSQLGPLERQAEIAKRYLSLANELKEIEVAAILQRIDEYELQFKQTQTAAETGRNDLTTMLMEQGQLEEKRNELQERIAALELALLEQREQQIQSSNAISEYKSQVAICLEREKQLKEQRQRDLVLSETANESLELLQSEVNQQKETVETLREELSQKRQEQHSALAAMQDAQSALAKQEQAFNGLQAEIKALSEQSEHHNREQIRLSTQAEMSKLQLEGLSGQDNELRVILEAMEKQVLQAKEEAGSADQAVNDCERQLIHRRGHIEELKLELSSLSQEQASLEQEFNNATYQLRTLQDLEENMTGYNDSVRSLLRSVKNTYSEEQVRGTIGSLLEVPERYELAIETALGMAVQNIVVDTDQTAADLIQILKDKRLGRATFLPISTIRGNRLDVSLDRYQGYLGLACDLVDYPDYLTDICCQLLGRIIIVDTLDHARIIAQRTNRRYRLVTLEGDVLNVGGSLTGGFNRKRSSGLLQRNRTILDLKAKLPEIQKAIRDIKDDVVVISEQLKGEEADFLEKQQQIDELKRKAIESSSEVHRLEENLSIQNAQLKQRNRDCMELEIRIKGFREEADSHQKTMEEIQSRQASLSKELNELEVSKDSEQANYQAHTEQYTELNIALSAQKEKLTAAEGNLSRSERELREKSESSRHHIEVAEQKSAQIRQNKQQLESTQQALVVEEKNLSDIRLKIDEHEKAKRISDEDSDANLRRERQLRDQLARVETELVRLEAKEQRLQTALSQEKNQLWETYELTYAGAGSWRKNDLKLSEAEPQIQKLKQSIKQLGQVNVHAVDEYAALSERYTFMNEQKEDVLQSKKDLNEVIHELTYSMREQFRENFAKINQYFGETFSELFGGGRGEIVLRNSDDVLDADIEIEVSPPGKKLQNMMLLSGGERALTAIALLFAILKLRPAPFCIMDEVEAALDDNNIFRFTDYINNYKNESQFIVVTHRKGTMEAADRIYGVTMPEHGVSNILSLKLED